MTPSDDLVRRLRSVTSLPAHKPNIDWQQSGLRNALKSSEHYSLRFIRPAYLKAGYTMPSIFVTGLLMPTRKSSYD